MADWKMFPMKLHYFFRFAGVGPVMPLLPVIVHQKGVPVRYVGLMWTVCSVVSLVVKATMGPLADYLKAHRAVMASTITVMAAAVFAVYWTPDMHPQDPPGPHTNHQGEPGEVTALWQLLATPGFPFLFVCVLTQFCCSSASITLQEALCYQMLGSSTGSFGKQRLWGSIGWGFGAVAGGLTVDWYSQGLPSKDLWPAYVMTVVFLALDVAVVSNLKFSTPNSSINLHGVLEVLCQPSTILFLVTSSVVGMSCGLVDTYQFMLVEALVDPNYPYLKILEGLLMGIQCLASEVPCFFLAGLAINYVGPLNSFLISILVFAFRFFLFAVVTEPWWFLAVALLHGPSLGLSYTTLTATANEISPPAAHATMQAVFGMAYFGGVGMGSLVGGWMYERLGGRAMFMVMGVVVSVYALLFHILRRVIIPSGEVTPSRHQRGLTYVPLTQKAEP